VAESSTAAEACFFVEKDGRGSASGDGDTANADPAYTSLFTAESSDWPLRRIVTFSKPLLLATLESSLLGLLNTAAEVSATSGMPEAGTTRFFLSGRATGFRHDLEVATWLLW